VIVQVVGVGVILQVRSIDFKSDNFFFFFFFFLKWWS
jgi:hypothetical protein